MLGLFRRAAPQPQAFPMGEWTAKLAAVDHWIREKVCPDTWSSDQKRVVIQQLREGKSPRQVAAFTHLDRPAIKRVNRVVNALDLEAALRKNERGAITIEFAIIAPVALLLLLGAFQLGMAMFMRTQIQFGAESAARCGAVGAVGCGSAEAVAAYAVDRSGLGSALYAASVQGCGVSVTGSVTLNWINFPGVPNPLILTGTACYPLDPSHQAPVTVAQLPSCTGDGGVDSGLTGSIVKTQYVVDAMPGNPGDPVVGGGTKLVQVGCAGGTWVIA